jgi:hypothetical protein
MPSLGFTREEVEKVEGSSTTMRGKIVVERKWGGVVGVGKRKNSKAERLLGGTVRKAGSGLPGRTTSRNWVRGRPGSYTRSLHRGKHASQAAALTVAPPVAGSAQS